MDTAEQKLVLQRRAICIAILALILASVAVIFEPTRIVAGLLTGNSFFRLRPTRYWIQALQSSPAERAATVALLEQGSTSGVPVLMQIVAGKSNASELRCTAVAILKKLGRDASASRSLIVKSLREEDVNLRGACAAALPEIGVEAETAVPLLTYLLNSPNSAAASIALSSYGSAAASAVPDLIGLLQDLNRPSEVRWNAARTIGEIGPGAISAVRLLTLVLADTDEAVREHSAAALGKIGQAAAAKGVPALTNVLNDPQAKVRRSAVTSLGQFGAASRPALEQIKQLVEDKDPTVRDAAAKAIKLIEP